MINYEDYVDSSFNAVVGSILKKEREKQNMSLEELALKINYKVKRQTLFYYETGRSKIKVSTFIEICRALHLDPNEIMEQINFKYYQKVKPIYKGDNDND